MAGKLSNLRNKKPIRQTGVTILMSKLVLSVNPSLMKSPEGNKRMIVFDICIGVGGIILFSFYLLMENAYIFFSSCLKRLL